VIPALYDIISQYAGKTIFIAAHNTVNRIILAHALGLPLSEYRRKIQQLPSGLNRIEANENGEMRVILLNDVSHFDDPNSPASPRMSRTGDDNPKQTSPQSVINTDGGAFIGGGVNTGGGKFIGRDDRSKNGLSAEEIQLLFRDVYSAVEQKRNISSDEKADIRTELEEVKQELAKGDKADETFLQRRLRNIGRIAPDILEVTLATMANPVAGLGLVAKKIAEKMKLDTNRNWS
jgi:predicted transport protein